MKLLAIIFASYCLTVNLYSSPASAEVQIKAEVLKSLIHAVPTSDKTYGVDLPKDQLHQIEKYLNNGTKLYPVTEYVQRYKKSGRNLVQTCFWIKLDQITEADAKVLGGDYPLDVITKYGVMPANVTDFVYRLTKRNDEWTIVSKEISGAS